MEVGVGKSVTDGEETGDVDLVVELEVANKEAPWEKEILLISPS